MFQILPNFVISLGETGFFLQFAKINPSKNFSLKIEAAFIFKKNIFLDNLINTN